MARRNRVTSAFQDIMFEFVRNIRARVTNFMRRCQSNDGGRETKARLLRLSIPRRLTLNTLIAKEATPNCIIINDLYIYRIYF